MGKSKITELLEAMKSETLESNVIGATNNEQTTERIRTCRICKKEFMLKDLLKVFLLLLIV